MFEIDLSSDTVTVPSSAMRETMMTAKVGDEQRGEDPSVNDLCARVADLLGQDAAIFLPSGIMCNQIALGVHCCAGDEVLAADNSHLTVTEAGAAATISRVHIRPVVSDRGIFCKSALNESYRVVSARKPRQRLLAVEQTCSRGGGAIWPLGDLGEVCEWARSHRLKLHLDGARLLNAAVASDLPPAAFASEFDSVWLCLTKGLGCPVGAVLAGSEDFIGESWVWKHRLGGAMRQAGFLAAAGLYALDHHVDRIAEDHANASLLGDLLRESSKTNVFPVETNIVMFDVTNDDGDENPTDYINALERAGVRIRHEGGQTYRAVTHLDVNEDQIRKAADLIIDTFGR